MVPVSESAFTLTRAVEGDDAVIHSLIRAAHINPLGIEWQRFLVARGAAGEVVGCAQVKPHRDGARELASIVTVESWRGRGVATALIRRWMEDAGPPLWLTCRSGLVPFYTRFGFRDVEPQEPQHKYFRRIRRVAATLALLASLGERLAVMVWDPGATES
jgi:N-acetylglutamate synthase-like GNAT family acetyltransferase